MKATAMAKGTIAVINYPGKDPLKTHIIRTRAITTGNWYIQQAKEYTHLCAVVGNLVHGYPQEFGFGAFAVDIVAAAQYPCIIHFRFIFRHKFCQPFL
jgi:hypothetical protein